MSITHSRTGIMEMIKKSDPFFRIIKRLHTGKNQQKILHKCRIFYDCVKEITYVIVL